MADVTECFPAMTKGEEIIDKGHMIRIEEAMLLLDLHPEEIILQEYHIEGNTIIIIDVTTDCLDSEGHPQPLPGCLELQQGNPVETMTEA